ncbi:hypothetical protein [Mesorhizobium sp. M0619]|uniref:hypothetical protein n=1 Tax=unclassified Mesorhizobium TaxID=325217 RepID=UPI003338D441
MAIGLNWFNAASALVPPNDPPYCPYFGEPRNSNTLAFARRGVLRLGVHVLVLAAPFATHFDSHQIGLNVPEDFLEITGQIPALDVAEPAADQHQLPYLMGIAELPFSATLSSSTSVRHGPK